MFLVCSLSMRMLCFVKDYALCVHLTYKDDDLFSERFGSRVIMPENLQNEQSSYSFSRDIKQISHYEFLRVRTTKTLAD